MNLKDRHHFHASKGEPQARERLCRTYEKGEPLVMEPDFWKAKNVFVTGCTGLIGSWLTIGLVDRGANVVGLVRDHVPNSYLALTGYLDRIGTISGSLTEPDLIGRILNEYGIDTCFHLAAQAIVSTANRSPLSTFESNVRGTWMLLEAVRTCPTVQRVVVASSDKAYGAKDRLPYEEDDSLDGLFPYDVSKAMADLLARCYFATYGTPVAVTRCGNAYGGGDLNFSRIVPGTIRSVLQGEPPIIRSDGTALRDYLYIPDIVDGYLRTASALDRKEVRGQAFNFGTNAPVSVLGLVEKIIEISGRPDLKPQVLGKGKLPGEIHAQFLSSAKAAALLGWKARYSLADGLSETVRWYRGYLSQSGG